MIRFSLRCANGHGFESWFKSGEAFDGLLARRLVTCPSCQTAEVGKSPMAPAVQPARSKAVRPPSTPQPMTNMPDPDLVEAIQRLRAHVEANSDYVGDRFAAEARAMHEGEIDHRPIHGEARADEARRLIEDGVPALPLPFIPRQKTN